MMSGIVILDAAGRSAMGKPGKREQAACSPPTIHGWIAAGEIPIDRQCQIEIVTEGALKADRDESGLPVKRDSRAKSEVA